MSLFYLINTDTLEEFNMTGSLYSVPYTLTNYNIEYRTLNQDPHSVVFFIDGDEAKEEGVAPFMLAGDLPDELLVYNFPINRKITISVEEYSGPSRQLPIVSTGSIDFILYKFVIYNRVSTSETPVDTPLGFSMEYSANLTVQYLSTNTNTHSVAFYSNDSLTTVENIAPYYIGGIDGATILAWDVPVNDLTKVSIIEYTGTDQEGAVTGTYECFLLFTDTVSTLIRDVALPSTDLTASPWLKYTFNISDVSAPYKVVLRTSSDDRVSNNDFWIATGGFPTEEDGLVAQYFTTSTLTEDATGNGYDLAQVGSASTLIASLDGRTNVVQPVGYYTIPLSIMDEFEETGICSLTFWYRYSVKMTSNQMFAIMDTTEDYARISFGSDLIGLRIGLDDVLKTDITRTDGDVDTWYFCGITMGVNGSFMQVNDLTPTSNSFKLAPSLLHPSEIRILNGIVDVGQGYGANAYLSDFRMYNRALTSAEISALYNDQRYNLIGNTGLSATPLRPNRPHKVYSNVSLGGFQWQALHGDTHSGPVHIDFDTAGVYDLYIAPRSSGVRLDRLALIKTGNTESTVTGPVEYTLSTINGSNEIVESGGYAVADNAYASVPASGWEIGTTVAGYYGANYYSTTGTYQKTADPAVISPRVLSDRAYIGSLVLDKDGIYNESGTIQTYSHTSNNGTVQPIISYGPSTNIVYSERIILEALRTHVSGRQPVGSPTPALFNDEIVQSQGDYTFNGSRFTNTSGVTKAFYVKASVKFEPSPGGTFGNTYEMTIPPKNTTAASVGHGTAGALWFLDFSQLITGVSDTVIVSGKVELNNNDWFEVRIGQRTGAATRYCGSDEPNQYHLYNRLFVVEL